MSKIQESNDFYSLAYADNFCEETFTRKFEKQITERAKLKPEEVTALESELATLSKNPNEINKAFIAFFVIFTYYRRSTRLDDLKKLFYSYQGLFASKFAVFEHIDNLFHINVFANDSDLLRTLIKSEKLTEKKEEIDGVLYDFSTHSGVLHLFSETCAKYYERNLEVKDDLEAKDRINHAIDCAKAIISSGYSKFYATLGRLEALIGNYPLAEKNIKEAISIENSSSNPDSTRIREFEQHLNTLSIIRSYDLTSEKVGELNKIKTDNYKMVSVISTILAFLIGSIEIFSNLTDPLSLAMILLAYASLITILLSVVLTVLSFTSKSKRRGSLAVSLCALFAGIIGFTVAISIIIS
ncbi:MAG TPA: hypothetical protein PKO28_04310 [Bacilli bacterium]|nr:hypothetical protein [Bacilli bacterium]